MATSVTGIGWNGEPFQQTGGLGAPCSPHKRVWPHSSSNGLPMTAATRAIRSVPPSFCSASAARLTETTSAVRLVTSGRPWSSRMSPRVAGVMTSRSDGCRRP